MSQITFFTYIYLHSDEQLRILLFFSCINHMALPIMTFNPWDIHEETLSPNLLLFPEIVYVFEKN